MATSLLYTFSMRRIVKHILLITFCGAVLFWPDRQAVASEVLIVNSSPRKAYIQAIAGLTQALARVSYQGVKTIHRAESKIMTLDSVFSADEVTTNIQSQQAQIIVAVGSKALAAVADLPQAIVYLMVATPGKITRGKPNISGISLMVDPENQLAAITDQLPFVQNVGVIYDPHKSGDQVAGLELYAQQGGMPGLVTRKVSRPQEVNAALRALGPSVDALLFVADTTVLTAANLDLFSLYSLNKRKPLIAFAPHYLRQGVALVTYVTPRNMGEQAGEMVLRLLAGKAVAHPEEPGQLVTIRINEKILEKLGLSPGLDGRIQPGKVGP